MKKAIVLGVTGALGLHLVHLLLEDDRFETVRVLTQRPTGIKNHKLEEYIIDFDFPVEWQHLVKGNVLFSTLGTTSTEDRNRDVSYKFDYKYQYEFAEAAARNGVGAYVLVSSSPASVDSPFFFARMKANLEREIKKLPFLNIHILQPGPLDGKRETGSLADRFFILALKAVNKVGLLGKWRPMKAKEVAQAMINASLRNKNRLEVYPRERIYKLSEEEAP
jgi:uncharacterized protein YbjT (DUF2867 family)